MKPGLAAAIIAILMGALSAGTQARLGRTIDQSVPSGDNYDKAEFRLWLPDSVDKVRSAIILVPGSNGDGRPEAEDAGWQAFATKHHLALVGCRFTDKPHDQSFIEEYVDVSRG